MAKGTFTFLFLAAAWQATWETGSGSYSNPHNFPEHFVDCLDASTTAFTDRIKQSGRSSCSAVSEAAGEFLKRFKHDAERDLRHKVREDVLEHLSIRLLGFDVFNEDSAREAFTCRMMSSRTLSELKINLDNTNINFKLFRLAYDGFALLMSESTPNLYISKTCKIEEMFVETGLTAMDPSGINWILETIIPDDDRERYKLAPPLEGTPEQLCPHVTNIVHMFLNNNAHMVAAYGPTIHLHTGVDLFDEDKVDSLLCEILDASRCSISAVYDVLTQHGIISKLYGTIYPLLSCGAFGAWSANALGEYVSRVDGLDIKLLNFLQRSGLLTLNIDM